MTKKITKLMLNGEEHEIREWSSPIVERPDIDTYTQTSYTSSWHSDATSICVDGEWKHIYLWQWWSGGMNYHYISSWDLSSYSTTATSSTSWIDTRWMFYKDPKQLYAIRESYSSIYNIAMSTDYDLSTATITTPSIAITDSKKCWCEFSPDWVYFYRSYWEGGRIVQYTLSTPWDLSTASETYTFYTSFTNAPYDIRFSPTWKKCFVSSRYFNWSNWIYQLDCSTPYMLSTATYNNKYITTSFLVTFDVTDNWRIFAEDTNNNIIYQYDAN